MFASWQISISAGSTDLAFALWLRDVEAIAVRPSPLVPGPLDLDGLPPADGGPHDEHLGDEWLAWWISLVDRRPRPPAPPAPGTEPAYDTPDPLGLARLPALRVLVARRWAQFLDVRPVGRHIGGGDSRTNDTVRAVEATLGRRARPFHLAFTLLPVRDDIIRAVEPGHHLVPERVYLGAGWPVWLRDRVTKVA